jgi:WD40 repeat protein
MTTRVPGASLTLHPILALFLLMFSHLVGAAEPSTEPILRIEAGMHTAAIKRIDTDATGRYAVTASHDKTARVWDVASGQLLQVLRPPIGLGDEGKLNAVALSPDGNTVAVAGHTGGDWNKQVHIYLFDRTTGQLQRRLSGVLNVIFHLSFSPDGRWLAATLGGKNGVRVWDWRQGGAALADSAYGGDSYGAHWSQAGKLATTSFDGKLRLYQVQGGALVKLTDIKAPGGAQPLGVAFSPDGRSVTVGYNDSTRVDVLDGDTLAWQFSPDTQGVKNGNLGSVAWSSDGQMLVAGSRWYVNGRLLVRRWSQAGRGPAQDTPTGSNTVMSLAPLPNGGWLVAGADPTWGVLSAQGLWQPHGVPPMADVRGSLGNAFLLNATGSQLQFGYELGGKPPHQFDLHRRQLASGTLVGGLAPHTTELKVEGWQNTTHPTLDGKPLKLQTNGWAFSLAINPDVSTFALGTVFSLRLFARDGQLRWEKPAPGIAWGVNIPSSNNVVVAAYGDGTIRWHRLSDGQELLAFFPHADRKRWVLWTPSGYYDASPGAEELIGWHVNHEQDQAADFFPASRFRSRFYRPDVIDRVLDTLDEGEALKQADISANRRQDTQASVAQVLPPVVELLSGAEMNATSTSVTIKVKGRSATDAPVTGWRVRVNGQAVSETATRNLAVAAIPGAREIVVPIPAQNSEIQLFAENRHGVSTPAIVRLTWTGAKPAPTEAQQFKPKLYVLAVGVSKYANPEYNLGLAAKDAADLAEVFQKQKGKLYSEVVVRLLTDRKATKDDVLDGLEWLKREVTARDVGVMFLAGHGMNDNTGKYFFMPHNADPTKLLRTGVPQNDIKDTLNSLAGKAVFFVDTCHSGNALGTARTRSMTSTTDAFVNELASAENGVVVFTASTGRQLSQEDPAWGNGAFTKAVVEGLNGKADFQKTGKITHKGLDYYVSERVKELTKGTQSPVSISPQGVTDFPIALVR